MSGVGVIRPERATGSCRREQLFSGMPVVDDEDVPALEIAGHLVQPPGHRQVDLGALASGERDPEALEVRAEFGRRRLARLLREPAVAPRDEELPETAAGARHPVHGQRVEELVGHDDPGYPSVRAVDSVGLRRPIESVGEACARESVGQRLPVARVELDRLVDDRLEQPRPVRPQTLQDPQPQRARASPVVAHGEARRATEDVPHLGQLAGQHPAEDRVQLGGREEVTFARGAHRGAEVVAVLGVVERELHELGEGDPPAARLDACPDHVHEFGIALGAELLGIRVRRLRRSSAGVSPRRAGPAPAGRPSAGQRQRRTSLRQAYARPRRRIPTKMPMLTRPPTSSSRKTSAHR